MLRYVTTGESHGKCLAVIIEGFPSGVKIDTDWINEELRRRQQGYGRGGRQRIETDKISILGGVIRGISTGAPIGLMVANADVKIDEMPELYRPRPGHADLSGALKYAQGIRAVLERASARETAVRVAAGAVAKLLLREFEIQSASRVLRIGAVSVEDSGELSPEEIVRLTRGSEVNCTCRKTEKRMKEAIDEARRKKDTLGGIYEICISGLPAGLGSYAHHEDKLDGILAQALMSIQSVKAVEIGLGTAAGTLPGSLTHDEIFYDSARGYYRKTNRCGGLEGGMTNGSDLWIRVTMKPIATLGQPLASVHMESKTAQKADIERSDICAVPAGSVIGENAAAFAVAGAFLEKFGGDSLTEIRRNYEGYLKQMRG